MLALFMKRRLAETETMISLAPKDDVDGDIRRYFGGETKQRA